MKPKYEIGDRVWVMRKGEVCRVEIYAISRVLEKILIIPVASHYQYATNQWRYDGSVSDWYPESQVFPTKEDLINSL